MRPASGVHAEPDPPWRRWGAIREPAYAPATSPPSESAVTTRPRRIPRSALSTTTASAIQSTTLGFTRRSLADGWDEGGYNAPSPGA